jgi:hypothetical protein
VFTNKEQLFYIILSIFPREYLQSICKSRNGEVDNSSENEEKAEEDMTSNSNQAEFSSLLSRLSTCSDSSGTTLVLTDDSVDEEPFDEPSTSLTSSRIDVETAFVVDSVPHVQERNPISPCEEIRAVPAFKVPIWSLYPTESSKNFYRETKFHFYVTRSNFVKLN